MVTKIVSAIVGRGADAFLVLAPAPGKDTSGRSHHRDKTSWEGVGLAGWLGVHQARHHQLGFPPGVGPDQVLEILYILSTTVASHPPYHLHVRVPPPLLEDPLSRATALFHPRFVL